MQCIIRQRPQHAAAAGGDSAAAAQGAAADADGPREMVLKEGDRVVFLGRHHYGCVATVLKDLGSGLSKTGKSAKAPGGALARLVCPEAAARLNTTCHCVMHRLCTSHYRVTAPLWVRAMEHKAFPSSLPPAGAAAAAYRISVQPLGEGSVADPVQTIARRIVRSHEPRYIHSGEVARRIGANPRTLGRITGNVWVSVRDIQSGMVVFAAGLHTRQASGQQPQTMPYCRALLPLAVCRKERRGTTWAWQSRQPARACVYLGEFAA